MSFTMKNLLFIVFLAWFLLQPQLHASTLCQQKAEEIIIEAEQAEQSLQHYKAVELYLKAAKQLMVCDLLNEAKVIYLKAANYAIENDELDEVESILNQVEKLTNEQQTSETIKAKLSLTKGNLHKARGTRLDRVISLNHYNQALEIAKIQQDTLTMIEANLGLGYWPWFDFAVEGARPYFKNAANLADQYSNVPATLKAKTKYWLASNYQYELMLSSKKRTTEHRNSLGLFKAVKAYLDQENIHQSYPLRALIENDIALYYWDISKLGSIKDDKGQLVKTIDTWKVEMLDSSIYIYQQALKKWDLNYSKDHRQKANSINNLGMSYQNQHGMKGIQSKEKAAKTYLESVQMRERVQGKYHPEVYRNYNNLARLYSFDKNYEPALLYYNKAINTSLLEEEKFDVKKDYALEQISSPVQLFYALKNMILVYDGMYKENNDTENLKMSLDYSLASIRLLEKMLLSYSEGKSGLNIIQKNRYIYVFGVRNARSLYEITKEEKYIDLMLSIMEKSKTNLSRFHLQNFGVINENEVLEDIYGDHSLSLDIHTLRDELVLAKQTKANTKILEIENSIAQLSHQRNRLLQQLEKNNPLYYRMKYQSKNITLEGIREMLDDSTIFIEYFESARYFHVIGISNDTILLDTIPKDNRLMELIGYKQNKDFIIGDFRHSISNEDCIYDSRKEGYDTFTQSSSALYDLLLKNILTSLGTNKNKLIILPDGALNFIPFELLLTDAHSNEEIEYATLPYLIFDYSIQYAYSTSLLLKATKQNKQASKNYTGYACSYNGTDNATLSHTKIEVSLASDILGGSTFFDDSFSKMDILKPKNKSKILHLAMHAEVDDKNLFSSKFILEHDQANIKAYDLQFADFRGTELAVLSACNSGIGKFEKGEGVASLAKSFYMAGCPSTVMSLWLVDDETSPEITQNFFQHLKDGNSKSKALREAKLNFLKTRKGKFQAHPFYWSSLVSIGNDDLIKFKKNSLLGFIKRDVILLVLLLSVFLVSVISRKLKLT